MANKQAWYRVLLSVLAALLGVQSTRKASEDFKEPSPWIFIGIGVVAVICIVMGLIWVVFWVSPSIPGA